MPSECRRWSVPVCRTVRGTRSTDVYARTDGRWRAVTAHLTGVESTNAGRSVHDPASARYVEHPPARRGPVAGSKQTAVLAGGCFWGVEAVFEHLRGVQSATSGYATSVGDPKGFVEAVRVVYDPARITYAQLLEVFFTVAHDPTQVDRQGPDVGPRYRSIVFVSGDEDRLTVLGYLDSLRSHRVYPAPIATQVATLRSFRIAEDFHQDFVVRHPTDAYVTINDLPTLAELRRRFPDLYQQ